MKPRILVHNTRTRQVEPFETKEPGHVRMYVCGPSVYDDAHLGHARSYVAYDVMKRAFKAWGYRVTHVQNFTDIEENITRRAKEAGVAPLAYAQRIIERFFEDMDALRVQRADHYPRVSESTEDVLRIVEDLCARGIAYEVDCSGRPHTPEGACDVYFSVEAVDDFGELVGMDVEGLTVNRPTDKGDRRNPLDFALWKTRDDWGVTWDSSFGPGRPGWHVECAAMALKHLGPDFDLHGGGLDLVFPHHESERAIARAWTGQRYCNHYLHNGFVTVGDEKMSKSLGNFVTVRQLLERHDAEVLRAFLLSAHYRAPLNYDDDAIAAAGARVARWRERAARLRDAAGGATPGALPRGVAKAQAGFEAALADDFRFGGALDALDAAFEAAAPLREADAAAALAWLREAAGIVGLLEDALGAQA